MRNTERALPYRAVLLALGLIAAGLLFTQLIDLVLLVIMTVIIALPLAAGASRLQRIGVPRPIGAILCLLAGLAGVGTIIAFVVPPFVDQVGTFVQQLPDTITRFEHALNHAFGLKPGTVATGVQKFADRYTQHPGRLLGPLSSIGLGVATGIGAVVVVLISALYAAINPAPLVRGLIRLLPPPKRPDATAVLERIRVAWLGWLRGMALDMLILGGLLFLGMQIIGLQFALGFAVFSALLTVIPNYGSVISAVPPIVYGLSQSFHQGVLVAVVYIIVNQIEGNLALPLIMGRQVSLHPAVVAIGVLIAGAVFGVLGLILSVPLISLALILIDEVWVKPQARRRAAGHTGVATRERAIYGAIALAGVLVVAGLLVQQLVTLLLAVTFTVVISLPLDACATALGRRGVPRGIGALIGLFAGLAVVAGILVFLVPTITSQIADLVNGAPSIVHAVEDKIAHLIGARPGHVAAKIQHYITTFVRQPSRLIGPIASIGLSIVTVIGGIVIGVMTAYYIAARPEPLVRGVAAVFGRWREQALCVMRRLRVAWLGWLRGLVIAIVIVGVLLWLALGPLIGLPYALSFAVLSGIAEVVPYLGALVTGVPPVAFALTISPGTAIEVLVAYIIVHQIEANIVSPLIMARAVRLHPAVIALGVIAVGEVFGLLGLIIAVPILSAVVILVEEVWVRPQERRWSLPRRRRPADQREPSPRTLAPPSRVGIQRRG